MRVSETVNDFVTFSLVDWFPMRFSRHVAPVAATEGRGGRMTVHIFLFRQQPHLERDTDARLFIICYHVQRTLNFEPAKLGSSDAQSCNVSECRPLGLSHRFCRYFLVKRHEITNRLLPIHIEFPAPNLYFQSW